MKRLPVDAVSIILFVGSGALQESVPTGTSCNVYVDPEFKIYDQCYVATVRIGDRCKTVEVPYWLLVEAEIGESNRRWAMDRIQAEFVEVLEGMFGAPKNNDGRTTCYWCGKPTKEIAGFDLERYNVCGDDCGEGRS